MNLDGLELAARQAHWINVMSEDILALCAVVRAAKELDRLMALPLRMPKGIGPVARIHHAEYGDEKHTAWAALRQALDALEKK